MARSKRNFSIRYYSVVYMGSTTNKDLIYFLTSQKNFDEISIDGDSYYIKIHEVIDKSISGYIVKNKGNSHHVTSSENKEEKVLKLEDEYLIEKNHFIIYPEKNNNTVISWQNLNGGTSIKNFIKYINKIDDNFSIDIRDIITKRQLEKILTNKVVTGLEIVINVPTQYIKNNPYDFGDDVMNLVRAKSEANATKITLKVSNPKLSEEEIDHNFIENFYKFACTIMDLYPKKKSKKIILETADEREPIDLFLSRVFSKITVFKDSDNLINSSAVFSEMRRVKINIQTELDFNFSKKR